MEYKYDGVGRLVGRKDADGEQIFVQSGWSIMTEQDTEGRRTYYTGSSSQSNNGEEANFFLFNHRGDTIAVSDKDGNIMKEFSYEAYGKVTNQSGTPVNLTGETTPNLFVGSYGIRYDGKTELSYMRMRWYSVCINIYVSVDLIQKFNRFNYVKNNPLLYIDPFGLSPFKDNNASNNSTTVQHGLTNIDWSAFTEEEKAGFSWNPLTEDSLFIGYYTFRDVKFYIFKPGKAPLSEFYSAMTLGTKTVVVPYENDHIPRINCKEKDYDPRKRRRVLLEEYYHTRQFHNETGSIIGLNKYLDIFISNILKYGNYEKAYKMHPWEIEAKILSYSEAGLGNYQPIEEQTVLQIIQHQIYPYYVLYDLLYGGK